MSDSLNPRMVVLYRHALTWATFRGIGEDIAHAFAFYRTDHYWEWSESDWDYEESTSHDSVWRVWCESEDRSIVSGERYVADFVDVISRQGGVS